MEIKFCNKKNWLDLWSRIGVISDNRLIDAYYDILECYFEPHRKYHNLRHIDHCLAELETVKNLALNSEALELAIWYHDAVYDIGADDNEERSAVLAGLVMREFSLPADFILKVENIILATKHDAVPEDYDAKLMLDIDISNLGHLDKFQETNKLVREEYSSVPENLFARGRSDILGSFLNRPSIYLTEFFQQKYEAEARNNIAALITETKKL